MNYLDRIVEQQKRGKSLGLYSCCSSNEYVIRAALRRACQRKTAVLIEATANQVNQYGGYTGMTPQMFHDWVFTLAAEEGLAPENVILGGDHLGPLTFAKESETVAMEKAGALVRAYAAAGFQKIHLDTSMLLGDDTPGMLTDETIARRSAELCIEAEAASKESMPINHANQIRYVIGSEVPIPGGVQGDEDGVAVTSPEAYQRTIKVFEEVYRNHGLEDAWERVIAVVVQPGVEFGDNTVIRYDRAKAEKLTSLARKSRHVLEGHSTDYQTAEHLKQMVEDGIAILKVGPALTFGLREGLFALENIEIEMKASEPSNLRYLLERIMISNPDYWCKYYCGNADEQSYARAFSYSDRMRYYLPDQRVHRAIQKLMSNLKDREIPMPLLYQYLPVQAKRVASGSLSKNPEELLIDHVGDWIDDYLDATLS